MIADDLHVNVEDRFSIGIVRDNGRYYLSFPVSNRLCDYEEFYYVDESLALDYPDNIDAVRLLLEQCRKRKNDAMLIFQPGTDRGCAS